MTIQWLGHACFKITHRGYTVLIDPYNSSYIPGYPRLRTTADRLLVSHEHYGHNYREGVTLSGRPERDCPFAISAMEVPHDGLYGALRGSCLIHILEADGMKLVHMGDIGMQLKDADAARIAGADVMMITAGSCRALPAQEVLAQMEAAAPKVVIPMHYRDGKRGSRRLERVENLVDLLESTELVRYYDTDTIEVTPDTERQLAVLKYMG